MPLPIAPIAGIALRYGAVALASYALTRGLQRAPYDQRAEDAMEDVPEGLAARRDEGRMAGSGRMRRVIRLGTNGPGIEIDATALGRIKLRRV